MHLIQPLRAVGGRLWPANAEALPNLRVDIVGDSIAGQLFVSLACLAWSHGLRVNLTEATASEEGQNWHAHIGSVSLRWVRWNQPIVTWLLGSPNA